MPTVQAFAVGEARMVKVVRNEAIEHVDLHAQTCLGLRIAHRKEKQPCQDAGEEDDAADDVGVRCHWEVGTDARYQACERLGNLHGTRGPRRLSGLQLVLQ